MNVPPRLTRRTVLAALGVVAVVSLTGCSSNRDATSAGSEATTAPTTSAPTTAASPSDETPSGTPGIISADEEFAELENTYDARLGVYAVDTGANQEIAYRADDRFGHASTFKALLCGVVLQENSIEDLDRVITYTSDDLVFHAPITEQHVETGLSIGELCEAAVRYSDNTATNLLLDEVGGPSGLGRALQENGDDVISVDRYEIEMSSAVPGDTRDTSTARSIGTSLRTFVLDDALSGDKQALLTAWLVENTTGDDLIRAGLPDDWVVGDKTGNGGYGTRNDIAVAWPPGRDPIVIAVLSSRDEEGAEHDDQLIADTAEIIADALTGAGNG
ncbi:class A beta-lactamase [Phytoactinopolyspora alkaliphila]|uniref:Beta-lactamase n=1 Tax=Phytoactinopolyspora alkaliphila TaxID=1783498 RepID=A0A6N9YTP4_9ACTN|nr:class A beta-lactamase [Phytoactinopolyspora alkaliphila]NED98421.1 class A beta-lactamase [Phytoactinopolyspora alkaliphila]